MSVEYKCDLCINKKYKYRAWIYKHFSTSHPEIEPSKYHSYIESIITDYPKIEPKVTINSIPVPINENKNIQGNIQGNCCDHCSESKIIIDKLSKRIDNLEKEISKKEKNLCIACWEYESSFALQPCGHKLLCGTCAAVLLASNPHCPFCRTKVVDILQIWDGSIPEN